MTHTRPGAVAFPANVVHTRRMVQDELQRVPGVVAPILTPFDDGRDGVHRAHLRSAVNRAVDASVAAVLVGHPCLGEGTVLQPEELELLFETTSLTVDGRCGVVAWLHGESTMAVLRAAAVAERAEVDEVVVEIPRTMVLRPTELTAHLRALHDGISVPIRIATERDDVRTSAYARAQPRFYGAIHAEGVELSDAASETGRERWEYRPIPGLGDESATIVEAACVLPQLCQAVRAATALGVESPDAAPLAALVAVCRATGRPVAAYKAIARRLGEDLGPPRPPRLPLPEADCRPLWEALAPLQGRR